jgi:hypothetical protein
LCRARRAAQRTQYLNRRKEQIGILRDESQWIVAQRPLSALTIPRYGWIVYPGFPVRVMWTKLNPVPFNGHAVSFDVGTYPLQVFLFAREREYHRFSMGPRLEAFSCIPTDGSVAVLVLQLAAFTRYLNELFLSY